MVGRIKKCARFAGRFRASRKFMSFRKLRLSTLERFLLIG